MSPGGDRFAVLTPAGRGAVAVVAVEGPRAIALVDRHFASATGRRLADQRAGRVVFGRFGPPPGEEVVVRLLSPAAAEVHCHGGRAAVERVAAILASENVDRASWQEWVRRHADDPLTAEATIALAAAQTERTAAILLDQQAGALRRACSAIESHADPEAKRAAIETLLERGKLGLHLTRPWQVVLAGAPNAGKSSLLNALLGYRRAIVDPAPGTTRDVVTGATAIDGWPVVLSDTAGLRASNDAIERTGVDLARERLASADLVLLVFDAARPWTADDERLAAEHPQAVIVHSKCDLPAAGPRPDGVRTSARTGEGIEQLLAIVSRRLAPNLPPPGAAVPFTEGQIARLREELARIS